MTKQLTGRHVILIVLAAFAVVLAANVSFITLALSSFTGEETANAYDRGLAYNEVLAQREAQDALGWTAIASTEILDGSTITFGIALRDAAEMPVSGGTATVLFRRPTHDGEDVEVTLAEQAPGTYVAQVGLPGPGVWDARGTFNRNESETFLFEERLWVE